MSDTVPPSVPTSSPDRQQFWCETIAAFITSDLSVRAFCRERGLHEKRFYTWRRNLGLSPVARPAPSATPTPEFGPFRIVYDPRSSSPAG